MRLHPVLYEKQESHFRLPNHFLSSYLINQSTNPRLSLSFRNHRTGYTYPLDKIHLTQLP